jgi:hypothetical protein
MVRGDQQHASQARHRTERDRVHAYQARDCCARQGWRWRLGLPLDNAVSQSVHRVTNGRGAPAQGAPVVGAQTGPQRDEHERVVQRRGPSRWWCAMRLRSVLHGAFASAATVAEGHALNPKP